MTNLLQPGCSERAACTQVPGRAPLAARHGAATASSRVWKNHHHFLRRKRKEWSIGELQAMRAASRFMIGLGAFAIIVSVWLLVLSLNLTPEQKNSMLTRMTCGTGVSFS